MEDAHHPTSHATTLVLCIGNALVGDDAAGCAVYERLTADGLPDDTRLELLGVGGLALLDYLRGEETVIVVDAVQLGAPVGTVHVISWADLPEASGQASSVHGIGPREAIQVGELLYPERMPKELLLLGIEGRCFDEIGAEMSPEVAEAVDRAVSELRRWVA